jgi:hypothetical protein
MIRKYEEKTIKFIVLFILAHLAKDNELLPSLGIRRLLAFHILISLNEQCL